MNVKTDFENCVLYNSEFRRCTGLKDLYCLTEPHKVCAFYKPRTDAEPDARYTVKPNYNRCGQCAYRDKRECTVQNKIVSAIKFCDCGKFERSEL